jgi:DNA-binding MarR family transcriptional regulator
MSTRATRGKIEAEILDSIVQMIARAMLYNHEVAEKTGLGPSDGQFLTLLQVHGPLTPGRLAELSRLTTGTVTGVIDRLERAGYVRRDRADDDRRKVIVSRIEERIQRDMVALYGAKAAFVRDVLRRYDDEQLAVIADFARGLAGS